MIDFLREGGMIVFFGFFEKGIMIDFLREGGMIVF